MNVESIIRGIAGLAFLLAVIFVFSSDRKNINWKKAVIGIILQFIFAFFVIKTWLGNAIFSTLSKGVVSLLSFTTEGANFVFGALAISPGQNGSLGFFFVFQVLPTIIFFASLMAILYHWGIMQRVVQGIAWVMKKLLGTSGAETLSVAANIFIGQTEAPLVIRPYIASMTRSELFTIMVSGMGHIAGGVMAAYVQILGSAYAHSRGVALDAAQIHFAGHLLTACVIASPATFVVAKMLVPETGSPLTQGKVKLSVEKTHANVIEAAASGASDGVRLVLNVAGMLLAFIALIALLNSILGYIGDISGINSWMLTHWNVHQKLSLEVIFGLIFQYFAYLIGVPWNDAMPVGSLMGVKLVLNEFVAYSKFADYLNAGMLTEKSITIATYALCGFANFSSIAIQIGGLSPLAENRRADIVSFGLKAVLGGTIVTLMTATIAGMLF
ncbi:MAG: NupC/NupG family nucleoside CNT transporter [Ignavibacteria bacterium]|nr:NupC/NupG family nucleoside CNT transporter [Ignavibacteria bacterium]